MSIRDHGLFFMVAVTVIPGHFTTAIAEVIVYVDPKGNDGNSGTMPSQPLATCAAAVRAVAAIYTAGAPTGGVEVQFAAGTYRLTAASACGELAIQASQASPIVFRGVGQVLFDATTPLNTAALRPVSNATIQQLLNPSAASNVREIPVPNVSWTSSSGGQLVWNNIPLQPSVWPNQGLGYVERVFDVGAIYAQGRTKGPPPVMHVCTGTEKSTPQRPCGANISLATQPTGDWSAELSAGPGFGSDVLLTGYLENDWYSESHSIARVVRDDTSTSVQFSDYSRYGICEAIEHTDFPGCGSAPGRFTVSGLISEVDSPGEYFYHVPSEMLYVYPPETPDGASETLGYWSGPGLMSLQNSTWVTVRDLTISGSTATVFQIVGGGNNTIGGCLIKNSVGGVSVTGGERNRVISNDIYDITETHVRTDGDPDAGLAQSSRMGRMAPTNTLVANNHITQLYFGGRGKWGLSSTGMGDRWRGNLVHDAPGQMILPGGPLSMWDKNEVFNTGYAEGDGGVIYAGACLTKGYGMHIRDNFLHHSLDVPGLTGRGGIYLDDHFGGASNVSGNVLYKVAMYSLLVNGGAGNNVTRNLVMRGGQGISQRATDDMVTALPAYDNGTLHRGDKGDYVWNTEQQLGVASYAALFNTVLAKRFPTFAELLSVNSTLDGWASASRSDFRYNTFLENTMGNVCFEIEMPPTGAHTWVCTNKTSDAQLVASISHGLPASRFLRWEGSVEGDWSWFPGAAQLEFVNESLGFDTARTGLHCDGWRHSIPVATQYRPWVMRSFANLNATAGGRYTPEGAAARSSLRSGKTLLLNFSQPCPALLDKQNCEAVWLDWGECEADRTKILRFTVEREAIAGGVPCMYPDGYAQKVPC